MGLLSWFQDCWVMMVRTKPRYIPVLSRKRNSIRSPDKPFINEETGCEISLNCSISIIVMCCSISFGIVLLLLEDASLTASTLLIPLVVAGFCSFLGGLCLAEYISQQAQDVPSIYSCCYQYTSEVLAFFIGWSWLFSQAAMVAAICKILVLFVSHWSGDSLLKILEKTFSAYAEAIPCALAVFVFTIFMFTGFGTTVIWYIVFIPISFILIVIATACIPLANKEKAFSYDGTWLEIKSVDHLLTSSSICLLFYSGPQSILRLSQKQVRQKTTYTLGMLNFLVFFLVLLLLTACSQSGKLLDIRIQPIDSISFAVNIMVIISACILVIEAFHPLHFVTQSMSADGLLFRTFSKKWKPFCVSVASPTIQLLTMSGTIVLTVFLPTMKLLILSVLFPLLVHTLMPLLVLSKRYKDNSSWQYEPMLQTTARNVRDRSRKKIEESQYSNGIGFDNNDNLQTSTACVEEEDSTHSSSETDIESVVQQYKDQAKIANMATMEEHCSSDQLPEPTPSSAFRAKLCIVALFLTAVVNSVALNMAHLDEYFVSGVIFLICVLFSTIVQGMLLFLPQNRNSFTVCCSKIPAMPWAPGMSSLISTCLFVHCLIGIWKIYLGWLLLGFLIYFLYGIRSSTAANSFHNLRSSHITLRPLPSYGNKCVTQIVPSQRKALKLKNHKNNKRKILM